MAHLMGANAAFYTFDTSATSRKKQYGKLQQMGIRAIRDNRLNNYDTSLRLHSVTVANGLMAAGITPVISLIDTNANLTKAWLDTQVAGMWDTFSTRYGANTDSIQRALICAAIAATASTSSVHTAIKNRVIVDVGFAINNLSWPTGTVGEIFNGPELWEWAQANPNGGCPWDPLDSRGGTTGFWDFCQANGFTWEDPGTSGSPNAANRLAVQNRFLAFQSSFTSWTKGPVLVGADHYYRNNSYDLRIGRRPAGFGTVCNEYNVDRYSASNTVGFTPATRGRVLEQFAQDLFNLGYNELYLHEVTSRAFKWVTYDLGDGGTEILWSVSSPTAVHPNDNGFLAFMTRVAPTYSPNYDGTPYLSDDTRTADGVKASSRWFGGYNEASVSFF